MESRKVLIAEDDPSVRKAVQRVLALEKYDVTAVNDGQAALEELSKTRFDLAVLDVMMPFADGLTVCREARHRGIQTPILLLTARVEVGDRVAGLDAGADDYLVKPFVVDELLARCRALLRRSVSATTQSTLTVGTLVLNPLTREVHRGERALSLTKTEFDLLELLMQQPNTVVSRDYIYETIWGYDFETNSKSLDVYIGYLRRKTEEEGESRLLYTIRGVGYTVKES
ncbi:MAG: response regulator transcription factor [Ilumatobacteraceae bacterium]|jgi:two-component system response regulator MprA|nr:response regulator transcription factor [Ilumatobacteraceae bacterium]